MAYRRLANLDSIVSFGFRVRECRLAAHISQAELARRSRMTRKAIGQIERGTTNPTLETMTLIAAGLRCELVVTLHGDGESQRVVLDAAQARRASAALIKIASALKPQKRL